MSALEQEIIEKFRSLDETAKQRVRLQIEHETEQASLNTYVGRRMASMGTRFRGLYSQEIWRSIYQFC